MNKPPILVLQMQRMGDMILSFPLLGRLGSMFPGHPLWVVGEEKFFKPLLPFSPDASYFSYGREPKLSGQRFHLVVNISHRPEAAALAGSLDSEALLGPWMNRRGELFIRGDWQLYRASLTHNNRYNTYHWADLHILDLLPPRSALRLTWPPAPSLAGKTGARAGLFLGASEPEKHPGAGFWAALTRLLLQAGHKPVLLGGEGEKALGAQVAATLKLSPINLTGRFDVNALAHFIHGLDLLITPDTGPMHIAAWLGTPVLNLSLGPVNPWETGPFSPGNHVLRAALNCVGCWRCSRDRLECAAELTAARVNATLAHLLAPARGREPRMPLPRRAQGLELLRTGRDNSTGLYTLAGLFRHSPRTQTPLEAARPELSLFWRAWFGEEFGLLRAGAAQQAWAALREAHPAAAGDLARDAASFALAMARSFRGLPSQNMGKSGLENEDFWRGPSPLLHPFSSYAHLEAQNSGNDRKTLLRILARAERLAEPD